MYVCSLYVTVELYGIYLYVTHCALCAGTPRPSEAFICMFGCLHACLYLYVDRMLDSQRGPPATSSVLGSPRCAQVRLGLRRQALLPVRHRAASLLDAAPVCYTQPVFHTCTPPSHVRYFQSPSGSKLTHDAARRARYGGRGTSFTPALLHSQPVLRALYVHHASSSRACIRIRSFHNLHCIPQPALYSSYSFYLHIRTTRVAFAHAYSHLFTASGSERCCARSACPRGG